MRPPLAKCSTWAFIMAEPPGRLFSALDALLDVGLIPHVVVIQEGYRISCGVFSEHEQFKLQKVASVYADQRFIFLLP